VYRLSVVGLFDLFPVLQNSVVLSISTKLCL